MNLFESFLLLPIIKLLIIFVVITIDSYSLIVNPLNAKLTPICHLMALLRAHHIFHFSRIRVKVLDNAVSTARICKIGDNHQ